MNQEVPEHGESPEKGSEKFMTSEDVTLLRIPKRLMSCSQPIRDEKKEWMPYKNPKRLIGLR